MVLLLIQKAIQFKRDLVDPMFNFNIKKLMVVFEKKEELRLVIEFILSLIYPAYKDRLLVEVQ